MVRRERTCGLRTAELRWANLPSGSRGNTAVVDIGLVFECTYTDQVLWRRLQDVGFTSLRRYGPKEHVRQGSLKMTSIMSARDMNFAAIV